MRLGLFHSRQAAVEVLSHRFHYARPVAEVRLAEQVRSWIPRAVGTLAQPTEIGGERQQQEQRFSHRASEMRDRRVDGNDEIECRDCGSGIGKISELRTD